MQPDSATAAADAKFAEWMRLNLARAADHFALTLASEPLYGWRLRSISAAAVNSKGKPRWLRVVSEFPQWASGHSWTGNLDANQLIAIPKPHVLDVYEWTEADWRHQRAEVLTRLPGAPVSLTSQLTAPVTLPPDWWATLRATVDTLREAWSARIHSPAEPTAQRLHETYGITATISDWETVHGDLHWQNLLHPSFGIVDWELWGRGPAGTDAATLLLFSLTAPETAALVHQTFADQLDTEAGRIAQLAVGARLLHRIGLGDFPELREPLHRHLRGLNAPPI